MKRVLFFFSIALATQCQEDSGSKDDKKEQTREIPQGVQIGFLNIDGEISSSMEFVLSLKTFLAEPSIKGLLLRINSGGGAPAASWHMYNELLHFKKYKPVVAIVENAAASGAYWVACGANKIVTSPVSDIGSIGVYLRYHTQQNRRIEHRDGLCADIEPHVLSRGKYKAANVEGLEMTDTQIELQNRLLDQHYKAFCEHVAVARGLSLEEASVWAEGREFIGTEAVIIGLADHVGSITDAEKILSELLPVYRMETECKNIVYMQPDGTVLPYNKLIDKEDGLINTLF